MVKNDNRDWPEYNEQLVKRGWFYLSLDFVEWWDKELKIMNKRKNGRPYRYPRTFIQFCALIYTYMHLPYRQLEGYLRALSGFVPGLRSADYTTLWERIRKEDLNIPLPDNDIVVAVDSTGIKVTNRGDWIREKHETKRRGWIKVHLAVDVATRKPVAFEITDEKTGDPEMVEPLLENIKINDALMDGAYDTESVFAYLNKKGINKPGIKIRKNAIVKEGSHRSESVLEIKKLGYDSWKIVHGYGWRWTVESVISAIKRIFGETVRATSPEGMMKEAARIVSSYTILLCI
jgi:hypothetical protein